MKKKDLVLNLSILFLVIAIVIVVIFKFVLPHKVGGDFSIFDINDIQVIDLTKNSFQLKYLLDLEKETFGFIFELNNCYSCIFKGLEELKNLKESGFNCIAVVVDDHVYEVEGWSKTQEYSPFYIISRVEFYRKIKSSFLPVLFSIKGGKIVNFKFITP